MGARADLRVRPEVQGAAVVLENKTGRILAMTGGFSYPLSQLNRVTQATRQPGSTIKPLSYLAALGRGCAAEFVEVGRRAQWASGEPNAPSVTRLCCAAVATMSAAAAATPPARHRSWR